MQSNPNWNIVTFLPSFFCYYMEQMSFKAFIHKVYHHGSICEEYDFPKKKLKNSTEFPFPLYLSWFLRLQNEMKFTCKPLPQLTSSFVKCCSRITSMYVLAFILGSGVFPPVEENSNRNGAQWVQDKQNLPTFSTVLL